MDIDEAIDLFAEAVEAGDFEVDPGIGLEEPEIPSDGEHDDDA